MKCQICYNNDVYDTGVICFNCIYQPYKVIRNERVAVLFNRIMIDWKVIKPYDNFIDWAMNRHT